MSVGRSRLRSRWVIWTTHSRVWKLTVVTSAALTGALGTVEDEPEVGGEIALSIRMTVGSDLDPVWTLVSERAEQAGGQPRFLTWGDRARLSPTRVGALADHNLAWRRGSVLNRLSDEKPDMAAELADAARQARAKFGEVANVQLAETLRIVADTARELGIPVGGDLQALLDAHSVSFSGGTIALHGANGVPLARTWCRLDAPATRRPPKKGCARGECHSYRRT